MLLGLALTGRGEIVVDPYDTTVTPGVWCGNFHSATNYAAANDRPVVLFWGKAGCDHCTTLKGYLGTTEGLSWAAGKKTTAFCLVEGNNLGQDTAPNVGARDFVMGLGLSDQLSYTPMICLYWPNRKTTRFSGWSGSSADPTMTLAEFIARYDDFVSDIVLDASYAAFPFGDNPCDRLEAIAGQTSFVDIPVIRTNALDRAATAKVRLTANSSSTDVTVSWAANETMKFARQTVPAGVSAGAQIAVTLIDATGAELATRHVWCLAEAENSPKNPYWIGEKTTDSLAWGEWSMDLDVVTNKVNAWNAAHPGDRAYAMMFVGGSTWCPDCAMAEANFFSKQAFKDWAVAKKVVFGVLDIPNNPQAENASPSQLRYESNRTSDSYVTLRGTVSADETQRYQSGAGYLSRHSVDYADALAVAARNAFLMGHDTLNGGWNRPERANKNRTGVPVLLLLRDDGTIAARWNRFSDVGPSAYCDGYLRRFEEMMAQIDVPDEESNDDKSTTQREIADGDDPSGTVSSVDAADVYSLADAVEDLVVRYRVTGNQAAVLSASIVDGISGTAVATESGDAKAGFAVSAKLGSSNYFLRIAPANIADGGFFGYTNDASTVCTYSIAATSGMSGGVIGFETAVTNVSETCGTVPVRVFRTAGSAGAVSVKVKLVAKSGEGVDERVDWTDATLNWDDGESGVKSALLTIHDDFIVRRDLQLGFALTDLSGAAEDLSLGQDMLVVNVYDDEVFGVLAYRHVSFAETRSIEGFQAGDEVELTCKSGAFPEGVALTADDGLLRVSGIASDAAGTYSPVYEVAIWRGGTIVSTEDVSFSLTVVDYDFAGDIPSLATTRTYDNLPHLAETDGRTNVIGLLTITVPKNGQLSAKYVSESQTFAYACEGWSSFDIDHGVLTAALVRTDDLSQTMSVTLNAAGGTVSFDDPIGGSAISFELPVEIWPDGAAAYRGQYTVQMPQTNIVDGLGADARAGAAYMALRMNGESAVARGAMLYAGVLPNGRSYYGSRTLIDVAPDGAALPFYHFSDMKTAGYAFSGGLLILPNAATTTETRRWCVRAQWAVSWGTNDGYAYAGDFNVYGGYYDKDEITTRFNEDFSGRLADFVLEVDSSALTSGRYGACSAIAPVALAMTSTNLPEIAESAVNPQNATLRFSLETGVVSGEIYLPFESGNRSVCYRGIALPGWQGCDSCSSRGFVQRPWAVGACSLTDRCSEIGFFRNWCSLRLGDIR